MFNGSEWLANEHNVILSEYHPPTEVKREDFDARKYLRFFEHPFINDIAADFLESQSVKRYGGIDFIFRGVDTCQLVMDRIV